MSFTLAVIFSSSPREMTRLEACFCNLNRVLLLAVGLWPYKQSKFTQLQCIFLCGILSSGIIFQLTSLITFKRNLDLVTKVLSSVSFFTMFIIQYNAFCLNIEVVKNLLMELQNIHNKLKDKNEIAIVYKYSYVAKRYTVALIAVGICGLLSIIIVQIWLCIAEVDIQMNATQPHYLLPTTEYFIDQEKYFYFILLHVYTVLCVGTTIMVGVGTMLITYIKHTCGMFRIASYRIKHAVNIDTLQNITIKNKILMTKGIICAIDIHRQAMRLSKHLLSTFEIMIICFTGCVVVCFSFNLFQLNQIVSSENNIKKILMPLIYACASLLYMFIANYVGQSVIDHNNHVFVTAYNIQWYKTPLQIQKLILFLLQRRAKEFSLNIGGIFDASMEGFATLVKASVSYFTVMHSTR